jgi:hypothetical protein
VRLLFLVFALAQSLQINVKGRGEKMLQAIRVTQSREGVAPNKRSNRTGLREKGEENDDEEGSLLDGID